MTLDFDPPSGVKCGSVDDLPVDGVFGEHMSGKWIGVALEYGVSNLPDNSVYLDLTFTAVQQRGS